MFNKYRVSHNIVNQLHFNKNKQQQKKTKHEYRVSVLQDEKVWEMGDADGYPTI